MPLILREFLRDHRRISRSSPLFGGNETRAEAELIEGVDKRALIIISSYGAAKIATELARDSRRDVTNIFVYSVYSYLSVSPL